MTRTTFTTSRTLEFFSEAELTKQIGHQKSLWPVAVLKELIDNALDACEALGTSPHIEVVIGEDFFSVRDNGPGIPADTIIGSLDFNIRVSNKLHYIAPTRGQQGNALKTIWAAPFVFHGESATIEVSAHGICHTVEVSLDRIAQEPKIGHLTTPCEVQIGTFFKVVWPEIPVENVDLYSAYDLMAAFSAVNPHAEFVMSRIGIGHGARFTSGNPGWRKWLPEWPTSPHWYRQTDLQELIAAYIHHDEDGGRDLTVRQFIGRFDGLARGPMQTRVAEAAGLAGASLADLIAGHDIDPEKVARLLSAMRDVARPVKPARLGVIGKTQFTDRIAAIYDAAPESIRYKRIPGHAEGLPFVLEVGLGVHDRDERKVAIGLNWSPAIQSPFEELAWPLQQNRLDEFDPVTLLIHLAYPHLNYRDRGKGSLALPKEIDDALAECLRIVAKEHRKEKKRADREDRFSELQKERLRKANRSKRSIIKQAAFKVLEEAYRHASGEGWNPANARQIMYAARPMILRITGGICWKKSSYFTQTLLPEFMELHPDLTSDWDVVFDARGHLHEPHTGRSVDLGTIAVRNYIAAWTNKVPGAIDSINVGSSVGTHGPANRYRFALFIEKEGFDQLLRKAQIAERFDIAIMSTKGMSVTAARALVEKLSQQGVTILVLRDLDKTGFSILHTLRSDTRRYKFKHKPKVIDLGLSLVDAKQMGLLDEEVIYTSKVNPRERLAACGATEEEQALLVSGGGPKHWTGHRIELNAMTSPQFIEFIERKLVEHGVEKVIPADKNLEAAYRLAVQAHHVEEHSKELLQAACKASREAKIPKSLAKQVKRYLRDNPEAPWDAAIEAIVANGGSKKMSILPRPLSLLPCDNATSRFLLWGQPNGRAGWEPVLAKNDL